jgi:hypothetical protein
VVVVVVPEAQEAMLIFNMTPETAERVDLSRWPAQYSAWPVVVAVRLIPIGGAVQAVQLMVSN